MVCNPTVGATITPDAVPSAGDEVGHAQHRGDDLHDVHAQPHRLGVGVARDDLFEFRQFHEVEHPHDAQEAYAVQDGAGIPVQHRRQPVANHAEEVERKPCGRVVPRHLRGLDLGGALGPQVAREERLHQVRGPVGARGQGVRQVEVRPGGVEHLEGNEQDIQAHEQPSAEAPADIVDGARLHHQELQVRLRSAEAPRVVGTGEAEGRGVTQGVGHLQHAAGPGQPPLQQALLVLADGPLVEGLEDGVGGVARVT
mmetsp:Transcript_35903/g.101066  ORF Transcript_35903/g.101066 Transcript_35903/m.101066 type:complete len:255 (+) Transcript_35903:1047-1811(+)